ncbi:hypothetical protein KNN17_11200 [Arthrobacter bambusae]|uniref:hypothetical protein n=1 Tax=Arthrobacter bambusae TaxID=1338426 RepID=UPI001F513C71|nr:hypothetical protein [Arthrobacter bambusae]MCI0142146.1 hypothetical protein [Arthrobacter bambusae]
MTDYSLHSELVLATSRVVLPTASSSVGLATTQSLIFDPVAGPLVPRASLTPPHIPGASPLSWMRFY